MITENHKNYKLYSYGKLVELNSKIPKQIKKLQKKINLIRKKNDKDLQDSIEEDKKIIKIVKNKIGEKPGITEDINGFYIIIYFLIGFLFLYIYKQMTITESIIFSIPLLFVTITIGETLRKFFFTSKSKIYQENFDKEFLKIQKKFYKKKNKSINYYQKLFDNNERQEEKILSHISNLYTLLDNLPNLKRRAKKREETAKIAAFDKKARIGAMTVRKDLLENITNKNNWKCPYCNKLKKVKESEADHIHPINKGGLSTPVNMVLICKECNQHKKALTLRVFAKKMNYNFNSICSRLELLGKDI